MRSLEVYGAAGEVTGSASILTTNTGKRFLIDCGLFQGPDATTNLERNKELGFDPTDLTAVILTHGHADHGGLIPKVTYALDKEGIYAPVVATRGTAIISEINFRDSEMSQPLVYPKGSVRSMFKRMLSVDYGKPITIEGVTITAQDAGHILGSASFKLEEAGDSIVFTGDLGNPTSRLMKHAVPFSKASIYVTESTYGNREHGTEDPNPVLIDALKWIYKHDGTLIIPAFAIGRTQDVLYLFEQLSKHPDAEIRRMIKDIKFYLDSPMALEVTKKYKENIRFLSDEVQEEADPFDFPSLRVAITAKDSEAIYKQSGPKVIMACSGMGIGGRIPKHFMHYLPMQDSNTMVLLVGYSVEGTPTRALFDGERDIVIDGEEIHLDDSVVVMHIDSLSAHPGRKDLIANAEYIANGQEPLRDIVILHGEQDARISLRDGLVEAGIQSRIHLPSPKEVILFSSRQDSEAA